jgi:hypothetical protein
MVAILEFLKATKLPLLHWIIIENINSLIVGTDKDFKTSGGHFENGSHLGI